MSAINCIERPDLEQVSVDLEKSHLWTCTHSECVAAAKMHLQ